MDLILFDVDGTLVDSRAFIIGAMHDAFAGEGLVPPTRAATLAIVGLSLPHAVAQLAPDATPARRARLVEAYTHRYGTLRQEMAAGEPLYDGAAGTIAALAARPDVLLGIATGKSRRGLAHILEAHGLTDRFVTLHTADDAPSKPDPTMVHDALRATGAESARTVMVGDSNFDMAMARAAGVRGIGVSWGFQSPDILLATGAEVVIDHFSELEGTLARLLGWPH